MRGSKLAFVIVLLSILVGTADAQTMITDQTFGFSELFEKIESTPDTFIVIQDIQLRYDKIRDRRFLYFYDFPPSRIDSIHVDAHVIFNRLEILPFDDAEGAVLAFHNINWKRSLEFNNVTAQQLNLLNSRFHKNISIYQRNDDYKLISLRISESHFKGDVHIERWARNLDDFSFIGNTVESSHQLPVRLIFLDDPVEYLDFRMNSISSTDPDATVYMEVRTRNIFMIRDNEFNTNLGLVNSRNDGIMVIFNNQFERYVSFQNSNFSRYESRIEWDEIRDKLVFINLPSMPSYYADHLDNYLGFHEFEDFNHPFAYRTMIPVYKMLHEIFLATEPRRTANDLYVKMKSIEKLEAEYYYRNNPSFTTYFDWQLYRFIDVFSDYGTRPAKGIVISLYVIFFFALIYFFFPNTWDTISRNKIKSRIEFFVTYFQHEKGLLELYEEKNSDKTNNYKKFKERLLDIKGKVPGSVIFMARPVYIFSVLNHKLTTTFLKRVDFLKVRWEEQPERQKMINGFIISVGLIILVIYDLMIKVLNALILSINMFTTLGFGDIPTSGVPRYLAVIEGFVGWFMLTFFSVSLIWQVLN